jgi:predicted RNA-binding Zn ribbon-like protein
MVNSDESPSRAASLALIGGELALDFANTASGRGSPDAREHLQQPQHVAQWAAHARVLTPQDAEWLAQVAVGPLGDRLLREALALREDVHALGAAVAAGVIAPPERVESLARTHARALAQARLAPTAGQFGWTWSTREAPVEAVIGPVSLSALALLQQADLTRVKQCQGERCGWLFFDATRNRSRRWCEMEVCGNRAKQKRIAARARSR